ncbi:MAG: VWA domain-containing protein [bacterium]|nr:VWA domain-containing protein [bacterium]
MTRKNFSLIIALIILLGTKVFAEGLLLPSAEDYPKDLLQNRLTKIYVRLNGQIAETVVYQEFVNEWTKPTNAVYSFPLPPDARATAFFYWYNDVCYKAVLKVKEQAVNPGTGEGGVAALVNKYIGKNGIKVMLQNIPPGGIQKVQLHYISICPYYQGEMVYQFPLDTQEFIKYPLDLLSVEIDLLSNYDIQSYDLKSHPGWKIKKEDPRHVMIEMNQSKTYLNRDLEFHYSIPTSRLCVDFFPVANDTMDGHFTLMVNPDETIDPAKILKKRVVFLIDNSTSMYGNKLDQSRTAIGQCLDQLKPDEFFNIITFNNYVYHWKTQLILATPENIQSAKTYLLSLQTGYGSNLDLALQNALSQFSDKNQSNSILLFTDGFSPVDPLNIEKLNVNRAGIFCIGMGEDLNRARLEMISLRNYGFVTYFDETDNLIAGISRVFHQINRPMLINTNFEFGLSEAYGFLPQKYPSVYQGCRFFIAGRYKNYGTSAFSIAGFSTEGVKAFDFFLDFTNQKAANKFSESIWAKEMIDEIERQIDVYGETDSLKQLDIKLSLQYNIRCKYTAYIADYTTLPPTHVAEEQDYVPMPKSYLVGNVPNPFNSITTIRFYLDRDVAGIKHKFLRIYNMLGQLVMVIDLSQWGPGFHSIQFNGKDYWGNALPSGIYICQLVAGKTISTIRISLVK